MFHKMFNRLYRLRIFISIIIIAMSYCIYILYICPYEILYQYAEARGIGFFFLQVGQLGNGSSVTASQCVAKSVFFTSTQSYNYILK